MKAMFPKILLFLYLIVFSVLAVEPAIREVWYAENIPVWIVVAGLVMTHDKFQFSNVAYFFIWFFLCFHTIGGHWTFEHVPFSYGNEALNMLKLDFMFPEGRNNYDRVGHFLVGVAAMPIVEIAIRKKWVSSVWIGFVFAVAILGLWGAVYEVIEMYYAHLYGGEAGMAFLGAQGDIWDAQKDMWLDVLGSMLFAGVAICFKTYKK